jgi:osmotically-inducible protein OsmY
MLCQQQPQIPDPTMSNGQVSLENSAQTAQSETEGNELLEDNLQSALDDDPTLSGADVAANVDDKSITLTGTVRTYLQHQRVLELVSPYYADRRIVDKVIVQ